METGSDSLRLELVLPPAIPRDKPVRIGLRVENRTGRSLNLYLRGRTMTFDIVVARAGGDVVWQRLADEIIPAILHLRTLAPAEVVELEAVWDPRTHQGGPLEPGEYTARGVLLIEGDPPATASVPFRLTRS